MSPMSSVLDDTERLRWSKPVTAVEDDDIDWMGLNGGLPKRLEPSFLFHKLLHLFDRFRHIKLSDFGFMFLPWILKIRHSAPFRPRHVDYTGRWFIIYTRMVRKREED